ncbi:TPA: YHYH domain-containing protein, partial [Salmonella enterica subsp. enterica serovar Typhimurium]|nr:YHYH domain-containing protein [Salmonella enterica subsp. enterica serovar Typhimurium]
MKKTQTSILFSLLFVLLFPYEISAHSGNTDSYGGHNKNSNRTYHCHSGQCLEDAKKRAYEIAFPSGQEAGRLGKVGGYE